MLWLVWLRALVYFASFLFFHLRSNHCVCQRYWIDLWRELNLCKSLASCLSSGWSESVHSRCWRGALRALVPFSSRLGSHASKRQPPYVDVRVGQSTCCVQTGDVLLSDDLVFLFSVSPARWDRDVLFRPVDVSPSQSWTPVQPCVFLCLCLATLLPLE